MAHIEPRAFYETLAAHGIDLFVGVPDSLLKEFCAYLLANCPPERNIIAANEGNAIGMASGYHIGTGRYAAVYMQNSGLGNAVNPLLSLADPQVYGIPMLLIVGWRGEPGVKDEPQHVTQGELTLPLLETMGIGYTVLDPDDWATEVDRALLKVETESKPYALVIRKDTFSAYKAPTEPTTLALKREDALEVIVENAAPDAFLVSTTGKTSRELFEIRERRGESHAHDFLTVGSMGHSSSIAMGMCLGTERLVYCIDGDGAFLMHMGAAAIAAQSARRNLRYIIINNGAHESVGGQPTVGFKIDMAQVLEAVGFASVATVADPAELPEAVRQLTRTDHAALVIDVAQGSRADLGRPTITPMQNKADMMALFAQERDS
ncbi:MAG: phosphonopyruvate decarboxylase [Propionibacteriaceae bacterium]|jgi:phosphonopyruvate decarboxylase|nr:phosphonopyruvate decarboxylase [Propionibacteriaceae bacterium]